MFKNKVFISRPPVNYMLNKRQIGLLTLHHICGGAATAANVPLLSGAVKEDAAGGCWLHSAGGELIPDEIGSCVLTKQIHSLPLFFLSLALLSHWPNCPPAHGFYTLTQSNAQINGRAALMRFHIYSCQINCVGMCPFSCTAAIECQFDGHGW